MHVVIDIGATKTLVATFPVSEPAPQAQEKFVTPTRDVNDFLTQLKQAISKVAEESAITDITVGSRGEIDSNGQHITDHKKLHWDRAPIGRQLRSWYDVPVSLLKDTTAAALGEAHIGAGRGYRSVLFLTISTGVGTSFVLDGEVVPPFDKGGGGDMVLSQSALTGNPTAHTFEQLVSGEAVKNRYGQHGYEIDDPDIWQQYGAELALGINNMIVLFQPDIIVVGGGMAVHFSKFSSPLTECLETHTTSQYPLPPIVQAKHVETAVIYGCYVAARGARRG